MSAIRAFFSDKELIERLRADIRRQAAELERFHELFPTGVSFGSERWQDKRAREEAEDRAVVEVPNGNPLPVDPFFVGQ